jgi:hypothetical protein
VAAFTSKTAARCGAALGLAFLACGGASELAWSGVDDRAPDATALAMPAATATPDANPPAAFDATEDQDEIVDAPTLDGDLLSRDAQAMVDAADSTAALSSEEGGASSVDAADDGANELCTAPGCSSNWWMFGYGAAHTGYNTAELGTPPMLARWDLAIPSAGALHPACAENGRAFVTYDTSGPPAVLAAIDIATGSVVWTYDFGAPESVGHPSVMNGTVYVQTNKGIGSSNPTSDLWAIDSMSGSVRWSSVFEAQWENYWAPTVGGTGVYINGGQFGGLYGFLVSDGTELFFDADFPQCDSWTPAFSQGVLYSYVQGGFVASDPSTGTLLWDNSIRGNFDAYSMNATTAVGERAAYVIAPPQLAAIDLETEDFAWIASAAFSGTPALADGVVYAISGGELVASDAATGAPSSTFAGDMALSYPPIVANEFVYVSSDQNVYAVDRTTDTQVWSAPVGGWLSIASGHLLVASSDGSLHGFTLTGSPEGGSP